MKQMEVFDMPIHYPLNTIQTVLTLYCHCTNTLCKMQVFDSSEAKFARQTLAVWDFGMKTEKDVGDLCSSILGGIIVTIAEESILERARGRTLAEKAVLYLRRGSGIVCYLGLQASSWGAILMLTVQSQTLEAALEQQYPAFAPFSSSIVPACVSVINAILPTAIKVHATACYYTLLHATTCYCTLYPVHTALILCTLSPYTAPPSPPYTAPYSAPPSPLHHKLHHPPHPLHLPTSKAHRHTRSVGL
jgi:hypothetical protein